MNITDKCLCTSEDTYRIELRPETAAYFQIVAIEREKRGLAAEEPNPLTILEESYCATCGRFTVIGRDASKRRWPKGSTPDPVRDVRVKFPWERARG